MFAEYSVITGFGFGWGAASILHYSLYSVAFA